MLWIVIVCREPFLVVVVMLIVFFHNFVFRFCLRDAIFGVNFLVGELGLYLKVDFCRIGVGPSFILGQV
ncbi:hypothetical protein D3C87_2048950 [compost metagenome]